MKRYWLIFALGIMTLCFGLTSCGDNEIRKIYKAISSSDTTAVGKLLKGEDVNSSVADSHGGKVSPLLVAVYLKKPLVCRQLIAKGANIWFEYKDGLTIFDFALASKDSSIINIFQDVQTN